MSELKIYVYDRGWEGASVYVTDNPETAKQQLIDSELEYLRSANATHKQLYYDPKSSLYEPDRHNPFVSRLEDLVQRRDTILSVYDINEGTTFSTEGE